MLPNTIACTLTAVPQLVGDVVQAAIGDGALVHPGANTAPMAPQSCSRGSCGNGLPIASRRQLLVARDERDPVVGGQLGVER
jgi:hypothetical protein